MKEIKRKTKHFKGWIVDKESVTTIGWLWAIEKMDTENNELVVFQIPKSGGTDLTLIKEIEIFIQDKLSETKPLHQNPHI